MVKEQFIQFYKLLAGILYLPEKLNYEVSFLILTRFCFNTNACFL